MIEIFVKYRIVIGILFYILWGASFFAQILGFDENASEVMIWSSNTILFIFWLIILIDMIQNKIPNKIFWILFMFLLCFFSPVVYLFRRKNLLHLRDNKFKSI